LRVVVAETRVTLDPHRALEDLYRRDGLRLWRALFAYSGDREVADDAMAEAFAQALGRGADLRDPLAWVWRVAFRVAAGELKSRRTRRPGPPPDLGALDEPTAELLEALRTLSPNQRAALVLHYYADYPTAEIAGILGASAATVRVHLSMGRKRLRKILEAPDE
jgi:RNA polymerase sigma-70 factor (ECF subfamily)